MKVSNPVFPMYSEKIDTYDFRLDVSRDPNRLISLLKMSFRALSVTYIRSVISHYIGMGFNLTEIYG